MPEHVGAELKFETIGRFDAPVRGHDSSVVDKNIERLTQRKLTVGKSAHRLEASEIKTFKLQSRPWDFPLHASDRVCSEPLVAAGENDLGAMTSQNRGCVIADAAVGAGDDDATTILRRDVIEAPLLGHVISR
jgi:hypothetical protein